MNSSLRARRQHMHRAMFAAALTVIGAAESARAGTQIASGASPIWGQSRSYTTWDVLNDAGTGIVSPAEGRVRDLAWWNGRLYCGALNDSLDAGPWFYTPGPSSSLAAPSEIDLALTASDPRRWVNNGAIAINTSGAGFGAFPSGSTNPTLALIGASSIAPSSPVFYTLSHAGGSGLMSATTTLPGPALTLPASLHYDETLDRFVTTEVALGNPAQSVLRTRPHNAGGLLAPDTSITLNESGLSGVDRISASFASLLSDGAVNQSVYLTLRRDLLGGQGGAQVELLMLAPLSGAVLSRTALTLPGFSEVDPSLSKASALAVDEAGGRLFIADSRMGVIHIVTVPAPGAVAFGSAIGVGCVLRRRR